MVPFMFAIDFGSMLFLRRAPPRGTKLESMTYGASSSHSFSRSQLVLVSVIVQTQRLNVHLLKDPADADTLDHALGLSDLFHSPLSAVLEDDMRYANLVTGGLSVG